MKRSFSPRAVALRLLARRARSIEEMRRALSARGFSSAAVDEETRALIEDRLLDDAAFARMAVESMLARKAVGKCWVANRLKRAGIPSETAVSVLHLLLPPERERELAEEAAATKAAALARRGVSGERARSALLRFLLSRGFSSSQASESTEKLFPHDTLEHE